MNKIKSYILKLFLVLTLIITCGSLSVSYADSNSTESEFDGFVKLDYSTEEERNALDSIPYDTQIITHLMTIKDNSGTEWMRVEKAKSNATSFNEGYI